MAGTAANIQSESEFPEAVQSVPQAGVSIEGEAADGTKSAPPPLLFHFEWHGMAFDGAVKRTADDTGAILELTGKVATLPFTAENVFVRKTFLDRYRSNGFALGKALRLTSESVFELVLRTQLPSHATPADVIKAVTACLLSAKDELGELNNPS